MHHLGIGAAHRGKEILAITDTTSVTVIELRTGEVLSAHDIDPTRAYWRNKQRSPGRWPGFPSPKTRLRCLLCRDSRHGGAKGIRTPDLLHAMQPGFV
jgi:hypothetical protein